MIQLTTNHKVGDIVYVVDDCVRRGIVQQVNFTAQNDPDEKFTLNYDILYDGFSFNASVESAVDFNVGTSIGSPVGHSGSPLGSPGAGGSGSPLNFDIFIDEEINGGGIYTDKNTALTAFGATLA